MKLNSVTSTYSGLEMHCPDDGFILTTEGVLYKADFEHVLYDARDAASHPIKAIAFTWEELLDTFPVDLDRLEKYLVSARELEKLHLQRR